MSSELPPALDHLRDELRAAAARDNDVEARVAQRLRRGRRRNWLFVAVAALVSVGGVSVAERALDRRGPDQPSDAVRSKDAPAAQPGVVASGAVADPGGGPPWAMRVFTNAAGLDCVRLARLVDGVLGTYDRSRTFRADPIRIGGDCDDVGSSGLLIAVHYQPKPPTRTIVYGLARDRRPVRITIAGVTHTVKPGALGSFIDLRIGVPDMRGALATTTAGGRTIRRPLGRPIGSSRTPR